MSSTIRNHRAMTTDSQKDAPASESETAQSRVTWLDVLGALQGDETRRAAVSLIRGRMNYAVSPIDQTKTEPSIGDIYHRRSVRIAVGDGLTATEDWLEGTGVPPKSRARVRDIRRRLECELWP